MCYFVFSYSFLPSNAGFPYVGDTFFCLQTKYIILNCLRKIHKMLEESGSCGCGHINFSFGPQQVFCQNYVLDWNAEDKSLRSLKCWQLLVVDVK